jgi:hypothetical protein
MTLQFEKNAKEFNIKNTGGGNALAGISLNSSSGGGYPAGYPGGYNSGGYNSGGYNPGAYSGGNDEDNLIMPEPDHVEQNSENSEFDSGNSIDLNQQDYSEPPVQKTFEQIQTEKAHYLSEIDRISKLDPNITLYHKLGMEHTLEEISGEYFRVKNQYDTNGGIIMMQSVLIGSFQFLEYSDSKLNLVGDLDGITTHIRSDILSFNDVLGELYNKYKESFVYLGPEMKLAGMIIFSIVGFKYNKAITKFKTNKQTEAAKNVLNKMKGPQTSTNDLLNQLGIDSDEEIDQDNMSGVSSVVSDDHIQNAYTNIINMNTPQVPQQITEIHVEPPKKRGRKKKNST